MERTLSAPTTFMFKYIFPVIWIGGFGVGTLQLWQHSEETFNGIRVAWIFLAAWVLGGTYLLWQVRPLKRVRLTDSGLLVSNYRQEITILFHSIERVTQNRWNKARPVTLHLRHDSPFGQRITFMPVRARRGFGPEDEIVQELRQRAGLVHDEPVRRE